tara:strand:- start:319 stop:654 length:336 start_codon:yes stop_codon:yes gene_type:complete
MENEKDILMMYHTTLRNIGLFTTISFASLGYSRVYRGKQQIYNIFLILASLIFLSSALTMNWFLIQDYEHLLKKIDTSIADKWIFIPRIVFVFNLGILALGMFTFVRETTK